MFFRAERNRDIHKGFISIIFETFLLTQKFAYLILHVQCYVSV